MNKKKSLILSPDDIHTKTCLPTDSYNMTITQGYLHPKREDPVLVLCHTVDTGEYAYQHVLEHYNLTQNSGQARLKKMCDGIGFEWFVEDVYDDLFPEQFVALRTYASVEQSINSRKRIIKNDIVEWNIAMMKPEYNVMKERSTEQFKESTQHGKPNLPI